MPTHSTSAYKDGHKWIVFCVKCGQEEPSSVGECPESYFKQRQNGIDTSNKLSYVSGIAKSAV